MSKVLSFKNIGHVIVLLILIVCNSSELYSGLIFRLDQPQGLFLYLLLFGLNA